MDSDAFTGFYERAAKPLWAYLARASGNTSLADDLMQESFVRFLCADVQQDGEVEARKYLFRIATNLLRDHWRRPVTSPLEGIPENLLTMRCMESSTVSRLLLEPAMAKLRLRERQLLWLAHAEEYSHREIAEIMRLGTASVRIMLFRARRNLAGLLRVEVSR